MKVGIASITCCEGCQVEILNLGPALLEFTDKIDIIDFKIAQEHNIDGPYDAFFLEGSICSERDEELAKKVREKTGLLIALGSCACTGGVQGLRRHDDKMAWEREVYGKQFRKYNDVKALHEVVDVDCKIRGCPIQKEEFVHVLKQVLLGKAPIKKHEPVCTECKLAENDCIIDKGGKCMGPITYCGCKAICPSEGYECTGCRGPMKDMNLESFVDMLKENGYSKKQIQDFIRTYTGYNEKLDL